MRGQLLSLRELKHMWGGGAKTTAPFEIGSQNFKVKTAKLLSSERLRHNMLACVQRAWNSALCLLHNNDTPKKQLCLIYPERFFLSTTPTMTSATHSHHEHHSKNI